MKPWLSIIGVGDDGVEALSAKAKQLINDAELFVGGARHLDMLGDDIRPRLEWPSPLSKLVEEVVARRGQSICVLATGDPMHFGIGITFTKHVPIAEMTIIPAPSAFSLAASHLGWNLAEVNCLTLHGRALSLVRPHLQNGNKIIALSEDATTPALVAKLLDEAGFGQSQITVLEHMGGAHENIRTVTANEFALPDIQDFNSVAIDCIGKSSSLSTSTSLPDNAFIHDGQLTKQEVRAITLSSLAPGKGDLLWDVGAGCGSVAVEWMRLNVLNKAVAFEQNEKRLEMIIENKNALGVPGLKVVGGNAPGCLEGHSQPDAIFVGGGLTTDGLFDYCYNQLGTGGRLVANAVTLESEQVLFQAYEKWGGELRRIDVSRAHKIGGFTGWKPFRQITHYKLIKK